MSRKDEPPVAAGGSEREEPAQADASEERVKRDDQRTERRDERTEGAQQDGTPDTADDGSPLDLIAAIPGVARIAAAAWWKTAEWALGSSIQATGRIARAARNGESPGELLDVAGQELRAYVRRLLDIVDPDTGEPPEDASPGQSNGSAVSLREQGAELLRRSADVEDHEDTHPAYEHILSDLAPDEGRILRLLATQGAQPAVDVRTARPLDIGSEMVASGLTMIGAEAGVKYGEKVHSYLNNLYRLGLIWFSREALDDQGAYQVLEAQPEVSEAMEEAGRGKTVRRSIHLTPFGEDFCETVLPPSAS